MYEINFLSDVPFDDLADPQVSIHFCHYNIEMYNDNLFRALSISFPESLGSAVVKRRAEFLAGRYCAKSALSKLGITETEVPIGQHRSPVWPHGLLGSISHSNTHAIAAVTTKKQTMGIGIDIEAQITSQTISRIEKQILFNDELTFFNQHSKHKEQLFTLIFSAKESFFKAAYPQVKRYFEFDAVELIGMDASRSKLTFKIINELSTTLTANQVFSADYVILENQAVITFVNLPA